MILTDILLGLILLALVGIAWMIFALGSNLYDYLNKNKGAKK